VLRARELARAPKSKIGVGLDRTIYLYVYIAWARTIYVYVYTVYIRYF